MWGEDDDIKKQDLFVPPTTSTEPPVSINISDTGAKTSGFSTNVSPPISPLRQDDPDMIFDQLLLASNTSSSEAYSKAAIEFLFERIMKEHAAKVEKMNNAVADSAEVCKITTDKVDKLYYETTTFMENFRTTFDSNTMKANE
ncbi:unnamed protein product [Lactuca saligna]|uniref:Uncharacterized protein n=1 Tax=Lactuca saligna TaxID=75948 RepID=A0AA35ZSY0_LACSI|nr:unnamed protein product [Lactuca saligna]